MTVSPGQSKAERRGFTAASPRGMLDSQRKTACSLGLGDHRLCHSEVSPLKGSTCSRATFLLRTLSWLLPSRAGTELRLTLSTSSWCVQGSPFPYQAAKAFRGTAFFTRLGFLSYTPRMERSLAETVSPVLKERKTNIWVANHSVEGQGWRESPGGPVVRTACSHCKGPASVPGWETKIVPAIKCTPKKQGKKPHPLYQV